MRQLSPSSIDPKTAQQEPSTLEQGTKKRIIPEERRKERKKEREREAKASCGYWGALKIRDIDKVMTTMVSLGGNNHNVATVRRREGEGGGRERLIAVAIDRDKTSRYALKWAIENIVSSRNRTLKLVHVKCRPSTSPPFPGPTHSLSLSNVMWLLMDTSHLSSPIDCFHETRASGK